MTKIYLVAARDIAYQVMLSRMSLGTSRGIFNSYGIRNIICESSLVKQGVMKRTDVRSISRRLNFYAFWKINSIEETPEYAL